MDDESGESMEPTEEVPLKELKTKLRIKIQLIFWLINVSTKYQVSTTVMDLIVVFDCILFVFMFSLLCFCVAAEFSVNKDLYISF